MSFHHTRLPAQQTQYDCLVLKADTGGPYQSLHPIPACFLSSPYINGYRTPCLSPRALQTNLLQTTISGQCTGNKYRRPRLSVHKECLSSSLFLHLVLPDIPCRKTRSID